MSGYMGFLGMAPWHTLGGGMANRQREVLCIKLDWPGSGFCLLCGDQVTLEPWPHHDHCEFRPCYLHGALFPLKKKGKIMFYDCVGLKTNIIHANLLLYILIIFLFSSDFQIKLKLLCGLQVPCPLCLLGSWHGGAHISGCSAGACLEWKTL